MKFGFFFVLIDQSLKELSEMLSNILHESESVALSFASSLKALVLSVYPGS